jgi:predicted acyl esterase
MSETKSEMDGEMTSEVRDGMRIEWDVPIRMQDGVVLRADVFRPLDDGQYPAVLTHGPYGKGLQFQKGYVGNWERLVKAAPEVLEGSSNKYQNWEAVDPEKWVPDGYVCIRIDSRGAGRSPGFKDCWSAQETQDFAECIEWAGTQPWSNGKVGLCGISYYAMNQWQVAGLRPPHLAAMCIWEGSSDYYRELCRHGGILCHFLPGWYGRHRGMADIGANAPVNQITGVPVTLPMAPEDVDRNRADLGGEALRRTQLDGYYQARAPQFDNIDVPLLSAGNWGGQGLHTRGNVEGFVRAATPQKWLEMHGDTHFTHFYSGYGIALQKRFFGHFLKGEDTGWERQPRVSLNIRRAGERFQLRGEDAWPIPGTQWTPWYLQPQDRTLSATAPAGTAMLDYQTMGHGITFMAPPVEVETEITGPVAARLWLSSRTRDADVFLALRIYDAAGREVTFIGSNDVRTPIGLGWLRASQRKTDPQQSTPWRPWHPHDEEQLLTPGEPVALDVEIWPTSIVLEKGFRLGLTVRGSDYEYDGPDAAEVNAANPTKGIGPFTHRDPVDRPPAVFDGVNTLHFSPGKAAYLLLPIIPSRGPAH